MRPSLLLTSRVKTNAGSDEIRAPRRMGNAFAGSEWSKCGAIARIGAVGAVGAIELYSSLL
jgi:hypothetical protein